jgi:L-ascorbate metabolism protein UlaG (beta-lactamase superfamily)
MNIEQLPPLDLVILSHFHGDHFDQVAVRELDKSLPIVTTPHATEELSLRGFTNPQQLDKWENMSFVKGNVQLQITATPGRPGPLPVAMFLPQVMGSILDFKVKEEDADSSRRHLLRIYITGDTLVYDDIKDIPKHFSDINIALLHLGGTKVMGIMVTMDAKEGLEMFNIINPGRLFPSTTMTTMYLSHLLKIFSTKLKRQGLKTVFTICIMERHIPLT